MGRCRYLIALILIFSLQGSSYAHPGRLDKDGGHTVRKDFTYQDGTFLKEGTYHYHRWSEKVGLGDSRFVLIGGKDDRQNKGIFVGGNYNSNADDSMGSDSDN